MSSDAKTVNFEWMLLLPHLWCKIRNFAWVESDVNTVYIYIFSERFPPPHSAESFFFQAPAHLQHMVSVLKMKIHTWSTNQNQDGGLIWQRMLVSVLAVVADQKRNGISWWGKHWKSSEEWALWWTEKRAEGMSLSKWLCEIGMLRKIRALANLEL